MGLINLPKENDITTLLARRFPPARDNPLP